MSLLLEALKKAALQKRHSEEAAKNEDNEGKLGSSEKSEAEGEADQTVDDQSALQKNALQKKKARDKWLEQNEPTSPLQRSSVPDSNTAPSSEPTYSVKKDQKERSDVEDTSIVKTGDNIAPDTEAVPVGNLEFGSNTFSEAASSDLEIDHSDGEIDIELDVDIDVDELEILDPEDELGEEIDFANEDVELESDVRLAKSKTAMAELLEKSHRVVRRTRRREIYLYAFFFLTAVGSIGAYYYYLSLNDYSLQISKLSSAEEAQIAEHQKSSLYILPEVDKGSEINSAALISVRDAGAEATAATTKQVLAASAMGETNEKNEIDETSSTATPFVEKEGKRLPVPVIENELYSSSEVASIEFMLTRKISSQVNTPSDLSFVVNSIVKKGFNAYQRGNFELSRQEYDVALQMAPLDRDALLGAAALASLEGRWQDAIRFYQTRLADYPNDEFARAGLLALASLDSGNPELKVDIGLMLEEFPDAAYLHFIKGAIHASGREWGSAQKAFFDAYYLDRFNADYAFNLAVSMDHLNQKFEAKRYYLLALQLQKTQAASFDIDVLQNRISQLEAGKL